MKGLKIHIIVAACLVTLGVAFFGQRLFYQQQVTEPLLAHVSKLPGVTEVTFETKGDSRYIAVNVAPSANLRTVYTTAYHLGEQRLGSDFGGVIIRDNRSSELTDSYYRMHFYIQQAISTGMFTEMAAGLDRIASEDQLSRHKVYVDEKNVYVQLEKDGHNLYEVISRPQVVAQVPTERGGIVTW